MSGVKVSEENNRVYWLDVARVLALLLIVLNHAVNRTYATVNGQYEAFVQLSVFENIFNAAMNAMSRIGVPLFLMITGSLVLTKEMRSNCDVCRFFKRNILSLLITTEIWLFVMYWCVCVGEVGVHSVMANVLKYTLEAIPTLLFFNQKTFASMWYMPMIIAVYTVLPLFITFLEKYSVKFLGIPCALVYISAMILPYLNIFLRLQGMNELTFAISHANIFSSFILYILAGYCISQCKLKNVGNSCVCVDSNPFFALRCW